jgi:hypothetical protein
LSAGDAPRDPVAMDPDPPASKRWMRRAGAGAAAWVDLLHSTIFHKNQRCLSIHRTKAQRAHIPSRSRTMSRRRATPVQRLHHGSTTSTGPPLAPEWSITRVRKSLRGLILTRPAAVTSSAAHGHQTLDKLGPKLPRTPPAGKTPAVSATSRRP